MLYKLPIGLLMLAITFTTFGQTPIEKNFNYQEFQLPVYTLEEAYKDQFYAVSVSFQRELEGRNEIALRDRLQEDFTAALDIPSMQKKDFNPNQNQDFIDQFYGLLVNVNIDIQDRKISYESNPQGSFYKFHWKAKIPVEVEWNYRGNEREDSKFPLEWGIDDDGYWTYTHDDWLGDEERYAMQDSLSSVAQDAFYQRIVEYLEIESAKFQPSTTDGTITMYTLKKRKMDFSELTAACDKVGEAISQMEKGEVFANEAASQQLDEAIEVFNKVIAENEGSKRIAPYPLLNIISCQMIQGNMTGALETIDRLHKLGGMFRAFAPKSMVTDKMEKYDAYGISYR